MSVEILVRNLQNAHDNEQTNHPKRPLEATMTRKAAFLVLAFLGSAVFQLLIIYRTEREIAIARTVGIIQPSISYYILNIVFAGGAILLLLPVLRHGRWWQRILASVFCLWPVIVAGITVNGAVKLLLEG